MSDKGMQEHMIHHHFADDNYEISVQRRKEWLIDHRRYHLDPEYHFDMDHDHGYYVY